MAARAGRGETPAQRAAAIAKIKNLNKRSAAITKMGEAKWLRAMNLRLYSRSKHYGKLYTDERYYIIGHRSAKWLRVLNSTPEPDGTQKVYWLRVSGWCSCPHEAVAWTFGFGAHGYSPRQET